VVRRFVEEYKNLHNVDIVDELVHEDCKIHIPIPGLPQGREGMRVNGRSSPTPSPMCTSCASSSWSTGTS
jgi:hypothetical protein